MSDSIKGTGNQIRKINYLNNRLKMYNNKIENFDDWWDSVGSGLFVKDNKDIEEHTKRVLVEFIKYLKNQ